MYQTTYREYAGILFLDERNEESNTTLGRTINRLRRFSFPDREEVLRLLDEICASRNNVFHNLAKVDQQQAVVLGNDLRSITENGEQLIGKIDTIYAGLGKIITTAAGQTQADASSPQPTTTNSAQNPTTASANS